MVLWFIYDRNLGYKGYTHRENGSSKVIWIVNGALLSGSLKGFYSLIAERFYMELLSVPPDTGSQL